MSDMPAFEIASFAPHAEPHPIGGAVELAVFRLRYGVLDIHGASLLLRDDGSFALLLPKAGRWPAGADRPPGRR